MYVWRPPCLADDLEVNGGIWRGETTEVGYDTFPNGWGVLEYAETDHLNRCLGWGGWNPRQGEVRRHDGDGDDAGLRKPLLEGWNPLLRAGGSSDQPSSFSSFSSS